MSDSPRIVTEDVTFQWDGVTQRLARRTVLDVPPGSALEAAIGPQNLLPLGAVAAQPPAPAEEPEPSAEEKPEDEEPQPAPRKAPAKAKTEDSGETKDGDA